MSEPAFRSISEVAALVGVPQHVLRFWEAKFPAIAPIKRGGNRRYYRAADVAAVQTVARLLHHEGYTIKGAQKLLAGDAVPAGAVTEAASRTGPAGPPPMLFADETVPRAALATIRDNLVAALARARAG